MTQLLLVAGNRLNLTNVINYFKALRNRIVHKAQARITYNELNKLSDRELKDIGLVRGNIRSVAEGTFTNENLKDWV